MNQRNLDKQKVKQILKSSVSTSAQITSALTEYFKKYLVQPVKQEEDLDSVSGDILSIFDGSL